MSSEGATVNRVRTRTVATIELSEEEALALLSMCALSIKSVDDPSRSALDKLAAYCKGLYAARRQSKA